ncbi:MAG: MFS transporter [Firmicutes bacterium]|nr:MFS transporter [Bacillota bacterium]
MPAVRPSAPPPHGRREAALLWLLAGGRLIGAGGAIEAMAFFTLYLRQAYHLPMPVVGSVAALLSAGAVAGTFLAGYLADRLGRRPALLWTMAVEALALAALAVVHDVAAAVALGVVVGTADGALWPAYGAAVADILPPERRQRGFALMTAAVNAGAALGPAAGGAILAGVHRFGPLFFAAGAAVAAATAALAARLPETRPPVADGQRGEAASGYALVARDGDMLAFLSLLLPPLTALGVFIAFFPLAAAATPGVGAAGFGLLFGLWGAVIAVGQLPLSAAVGHMRPVTAIALGYALVAAAFVPMAVWPGPWGDLLGVLALAAGEMFSSPPTGALVANLAPVHARARYQSTIGLVWAAGGVVGPALAGWAYGRVGVAPFWAAAAVLAALPLPLFPLWLAPRPRVRRAEAQALGQAPAASPS